MTAQRGKSPERPFATIYRELSAYPSEAVTEAIEGQRLANRSITASSTREVLDRRLQIAAKIAEKPVQHDASHLARVAALVTPKRDTLDEKIARCMTRKGISRREQAILKNDEPHYHIRRKDGTEYIERWAGSMGRLPWADWWESECHCKDHESASNHDLNALREDILSELTIY